MTFNNLSVTSSPIGTVSWIEQAFKAKNFDKSIFSVTKKGTIDDIDNLFSQIKELIINSWSSKYLNNTMEYILILDTGFIWISLSLINNDVSVNFSTYDSDLAKNLEQIFEKYVVSPDEKSIHVLVRQQGGLCLTKIDSINSPLVKENYPKDVLENYHHIVECIGSNSPCGRLVLLDGLPGTGKSYLIRALMHDVEAKPIIIPSSVISQITGPDILPPLLEQKHKTAPMLIIIEDADIALVTRSKGNFGAIAELLNLGDGLLGELLNVRVIATTNAERTDLDDAIVRPGRMCRHLHLGLLDHNNTNEIYTKLTGLEVNLPPMTLAEVYRRARLDGWKPNHQEVVGQYL